MFYASERQTKNVRTLVVYFFDLSIRAGCDKEARMTFAWRLESLVASDHFGIHTTEPAAAGGRT